MAKRGPKPGKGAILTKSPSRNQNRDFIAPKHLSKRALTIWDEYLPSIMPSLTKSRVPVYSTWCQLFEQIEICSKVLDKEGYTVFNGVGTPVSRPEVKIMQDSQRLFLSYSRQLGITVSSEVIDSTVQPVSTAGSPNEPLETAKEAILKARARGDKAPEWAKHALEIPARRARLEAQAKNEEPPEWAKR